MIPFEQLGQEVVATLALDALSEADRRDEARRAYTALARGAVDHPDLWGRALAWIPADLVRLRVHTDVGWDLLRDVVRAWARPSLADREALEITVLSEIVDVVRARDEDGRVLAIVNTPFARHVADDELRAAAARHDVRLGQVVALCAAVDPGAALMWADRGRRDWSLPGCARAVADYVDLPVPLARLD